MAAVRTRRLSRGGSLRPARGGLATGGHDWDGRGEILALRWRDIDLPRARLAVRRALVEVDYRVVESTPKGTAARTIDLDWRTVELLRVHGEAQRQDRELWGDAYKNSDLVAAWENCSPIHPQALSRMFRARVRAAGLRMIRLHDLRHTHATLALQAGVPLPVGSERTRTPQPGVHPQSVRPRRSRHASGGGCGCSQFIANAPRP